jgi:hypothetical protein
VTLPFRVPPGQNSVRVRYCYDQPSSPTSAEVRDTLDIGLYGPRRHGDRIWGRREFRGWSGSNLHTFRVTPEGYSPETGHGTSRGYLPGRIKGGRWAVELGLASIVDPARGDPDDHVDWRVEVAWRHHRSNSDEPYRPAGYHSRPARHGAGWYSGDFHVHTLMSGDAASATFSKVFGYAFCPDPNLGPICSATSHQSGAGLDFVNVNDHNTGAAWSEIGRYQRRYPGHLIIRSEEVTTYRGHTQSDANPHYVDYRTGPIYLLRRSGKLKQLRGPRSPGRRGGIFDQVHAGGGFTQINHPTIFPSAIPGFAEICRGCPWSYSDRETRYAKVDAIEVSTGPAGLNQPTSPGPNPFTPLALDFYEQAIDAGGLDSNHIAAVGGSDSHSAGEVDQTDVTGAPIGEPTTVVHAPELSERGIEQGVKAGSTYVKLWGGDGPDVRLTASHGSARAIIGGTIRAASAQFEARVLNLNRVATARPGAYSLVVLRNGQPTSFTVIPPGQDTFRSNFAGTGPGRYQIEVIRPGVGVASIETVSSPIYLQPSGGGG